MTADDWPYNYRTVEVNELHKQSYAQSCRSRQVCIRLERLRQRGVPSLCERRLGIPSNHGWGTSRRNLSDLSLGFDRCCDGWSRCSSKRRWDSQNPLRVWFGNRAPRSCACRRRARWTEWKIYDADHINRRSDHSRSSDRGGRSRMGSGVEARRQRSNVGPSPL